jgi:hypothetical protein
MVEDVRIVRHVEHDVEHQLVIGSLALMEKIELAFQNVEKLGEVDVLRVPLGEDIGHGGLVRRVEDCRGAERVVRNDH